VPERRRRSVCCCLLALWLLWCVGGGAFAAAMIIKLTTELDFVLCEVSACVPGDKHCEPCTDPDDACSSRLDTYSSETLALPMNITYAVYNPIFIGYTVERLVMLTSLDPIPPLSAAEMLDLDPLEAHEMGIPIVCESWRASYTAGWGEELSMRCMSRQDAETIGRLNAAQQGTSDEEFNVRVAFRTKLPVVGWNFQMAQDASRYADSFNFADPDQDPAGLASCSRVSGVKFGAPENVLALYDFENYKVSVCAPEFGEFAQLIADTSGDLLCMTAGSWLPPCWWTDTDGSGSISLDETFHRPLKVTIPIEMYNSAGFNLTLNINGSAARVQEEDTGDYIATGYLHETVTIPPRSTKMIYYYSDIRDFIKRYARENGLVSLTAHSFDKVLNSPVVLDIISRATILGTTYDQEFAISHTSLIGLASLSGCRCEVGPDPKECRTNASTYAEQTAANFGAGRRR